MAHRVDYDIIPEGAIIPYDFDMVTDPPISKQFWEICSGQLSLASWTTNAPPINNEQRMIRGGPSESVGGSNTHPNLTHTKQNRTLAKTFWNSAQTAHDHGGYGFAACIKIREPSGTGYAWFRSQNGEASWTSEREAGYLLYGTSSEPVNEGPVMSGTTSNVTMTWSTGNVDFLGIRVDAHSGFSVLPQRITTRFFLKWR